MKTLLAIGLTFAGLTAATAQPTGRTAIATPPQSQHINVGERATFSVTTIGDTSGYQWKKNGVAIAGATSSTYSIARVAGTDMGFYSVAVSDSRGEIESPVAILTVATNGASQLTNLSTRGLVPMGGDLTVGFVIRGDSAKSVLVRAAGPALGNLGVTDVLANPRLDLSATGVNPISRSNEDWGGDATLANAFAAVGAFPFSTASKDAAVSAVLPAMGYSARVGCTAGGTGIALAEIYDCDPLGTGSRLANVSTLGFAGTGTMALVSGFVINGTAPKRLLIRAVGPGLVPFGVGAVLADPQLTVIPFGKSFAVAGNDNWGGDSTLADAFASVGAFALSAASNDAAVVVRLPPGGYTVMVSGAGNTIGRTLVEIYDLDP